MAMNPGIIEPASISVVEENLFIKKPFLQVTIYNCFLPFL
jgi:hypothetical protein